MAKRYTVRAAPGISEHLGTTYLMVKGPGVGNFLTMGRIAALLEATLNAAVAFTEPPNATPEGTKP